MNDLTEKDFDDFEVYCRFCLKVDEENHLCIVKQCKKCGQYEYDCVCWYDECLFCDESIDECECGDDYDVL